MSLRDIRIPIEEGAGLRARRNTIADAMARCAQRFGPRELLIFGERRWTARGMNEAAGRIARRFVEAGLRRGDRLVAFGKNSDAYLLLWLACCRAGIVHVPANFALSARELAYILGHCGASGIIADQDMADCAETARMAASVPVSGRFMGGEFDVLGAALDSRLPEFTDDSVRETHLAQILYTSGTTAAPKGAMMTNGALLAEYMSCIADNGLSPDDRSLAAMPLYHAAALHAKFMPLSMIGGLTVVLEKPAHDQILGTIEVQRITSFFAPPTVWIGLMRHPDFDRRDLSSLRKIVSGAAIMPAPVQAELTSRLPHAGFFNSYGQSEIGPLASVLRPEDQAARPRSCGRPVLNVETRIVDPAMRECGPGELGEIVHRSPQLLTGYWNDPEATAEAFAGGWFHSGDIGYRDAEGFLYVVDRVKDIINTGGVTVPSREVEEALLTHQAVSEAAVIGLPHAVWVEALTAVIVLRDGAAVTEAALIDHVRGQLAPHKVPKRVILTDSLPRNTAGKILKRTLRAQFGGSADALPGADT